MGGSVTTGNGSRLRIDRLRTDRRTLLAFQTEAPPGLKIEFEIRIDGRPAEDLTLIGASGKRPGQMPFSVSRKGATMTEDAEDPGAAGSGAEVSPAPGHPQVRLWFRPGQFGRKVRADMKSETRRELRALGYIQ
jgi:hypothetical protein